MCSRGRGHYEVVCHSVNTVRVVEENTFLGNMEAEITIMKETKISTVSDYLIKDWTKP